MVPDFAPAATHVWDATTGAWSDAAHWDAAGVPSGDPSTVLQFGSGGANYVSTFDRPSPFQLNGLLLNAAAGRVNAITAPTLSNTLDFVASAAAQPAVNLSGGGTFRIANHVRVGDDANLTLNVAAGSALVFATGAAPGGGGHRLDPTAAGNNSTVTVEGGGTVVWRSFTVPNVVVNNGTILTDADGDYFGDVTNITIGAAGVIDTGGFNEGYGSLAASATTALLRGRVNVGAATGTFAYAGRITDRPAGVAVPGFGTAGGAAGTGSVAKNGGHTFVLSGANTYGGATEANAGVLVYAGDPASATTSNGYATGAITSSPFGRGTLTLNGGTVRSDGSRTLVNAMTIAANPANAIDVADGAEFTTTGTVTYTGTVNKTGAGLWRIGGGNGNFNAASVLNVNAGEVRLEDLTTGDMNPAAINVNDGGTFTFGPSGGGGNPDLPNGTYVIANPGGVVVWNMSEDYGGVHLRGGAVRMSGNINLAGAVASELRSGTIDWDANEPQIGGAGVVDKTTDGTVVVNGIPLVNNGGLNLREGVLETNTTVGGNGTLTFGTATTHATLRYSGFGGTVAKPVVLEAGGGTIEVTDGGTALVAAGVVAGPGGLTKGGAGNLTLTGNNTYAGTTTVNAGTLQIGEGGPAGAIGGGNVVTKAGGTLAVNRSDDVTLANPISGTGGVTKLGGNTVNLTGALSYTGTTRVSAGTLRVSPFTTGTLDVNGGATLAVASGGATPGTLTASTVNLSGAGSTLRFELNTAGGNPTAPLLAVTGSNGLKLNGGAHTLAVASAGGFAVGSFPVIDYGGTPVTSGFSLAPLPARTVGGLVYDAANTRINLNITGVDSIRWNGNAGPDWDVGTDVNVGGTNNWRLASNGSATNFVTNDIVAFDDTAAGPTGVTLTTTLRPAAVTVDNTTKAYTFGGTGSIAGTASLTKRGANTLTVVTNNSYTGGTNVAAGTLRVGTGGAAGSIGTGNLVNDGAVVWDRSDDVTFAGNVSGAGALAKQGAGTLTLTGAYTLAGATTLAAGTVELNNTANYTYPGKFTGPGALLKDGPATVALTGASDHTGGTRVAGGMLQVGDGGTAGSLGGDVVTDATLAFNRSDGHTFAGAVSGTGGVTHLGAGTATLSGTLTYAGPTVVSAGTLALTGANALPGTFAVATGATLRVDTAAGDAQTFAGVVGGAGTFAKAGPGSLTLTANNNPFTGSVNVDGGTLVLSDPGAGTGTGGDLGAAAIVVNNGATFQFGDGDVTGENPDLPDNTFITVNPGGTLLWRVGEQLGGVNLQGGTIQLDGASITSNAPAEQWSSGTVTGTANAKGGGAVVTKTTGGTVNVTGGATVGSTLDIREGAVAFAAANNLGTAAVRLGAGGLGAGGTTGTFEYQGATSASRGGAFALNGAGTLRVLSGSAALTLTGALSGAGSLTKDGPGTLALSGNNTFTGGTTVSAGTLLAMGQTGANSATGTGPVSVTSGATVGGTGSIAGPLAIAGTVSPGATGVGRLSAGNTTLAAGGAYRVEITDAGGSAGVGFDQVAGRAGATLAATATPAAPFTIAVVSLDDNSAPGAAANFNPDQSYAWPIASFPGGVTGFDPAAFDVSTAGFTNAHAGTFSLAASGTDLTLVYSPVPEPAGLAALGVASAGLLARRRRGRALR